jgi:hypothetical protein
MAQDPSKLTNRPFNPHELQLTVVHPVLPDASVAEYGRAPFGGWKRRSDLYKAGLVDQSSAVIRTTSSRITPTSQQQDDLNASRPRCDSAGGDGVT